MRVSYCLNGNWKFSSKSNMDMSIREQYINALVDRHMGSIEKLCGAALSVGMIPEIKYYQSFNLEDPFALITTVRIGRNLFRVDNGDIVEMSSKED